MHVKSCINYSKKML